MKARIFGHFPPGRAALAVCVALSLSGCADMTTAKVAAKRGDYAEARNHLEELAEFGLPEAQTELGFLLTKDGTGVTDYEKGRTYLEQAAEHGDARACMELGKLYEKGRGVTANSEKAMEFYQKAMDLGYNRAAYQYGQMVEKNGDFNKAEALYKQALDGGYSRAAARIGTLFLKGKGRPADPVTALAWTYVAQRLGTTDLEDSIATQETALGPEKAAQARTLSGGLYP